MGKFRVEITELAKKQIAKHFKSGNQANIKKIAIILQELSETPYTGVGKPEALKHELSGLWSRRITKEHPLVYSVSDQEIVIISCKFHY